MSDEFSRFAQDRGSRSWAMERMANAVLFHGDGALTAEEWAELTDMTADTARRLLNILTADGTAERITLEGERAARWREKRPPDPPPPDDDDDAREAPGSPVVVVTVQERAEVESLVGDLRRAYDSGKLKFKDRELEAAFLAQTDTLSAQLRSPRPRRDVILAALSGLDAEVGEMLRWGSYGALGQVLFEVIKRVSRG